MRTIILMSLFILSAYSQEEAKVYKQFLKCSHYQADHLSLEFNIRELQTEINEPMRGEFSRIESGWANKKISYGDDKLKMILNPSSCELRITSTQNSQEEFVFVADFSKFITGGRATHGAKVYGSIIDSFSLTGKNMQGSFFSCVANYKLTDLVESICHKNQNYDGEIDISSVPRIIRTEFNGVETQMQIDSQRSIDEIKMDKIKEDKKSNKR